MRMLRLHHSILPVDRRREFWLLCTFWLLVASLFLLQDYMSAQWRGSYYSLGESLAFKTFWLLFIPFGYLYSYLHHRLIPPGSSGPSYVAIRLMFIPLAAFSHLLIFSLLLSLVSQFIHSQPWQFTWLLEKKLVTHLVYTVAVYTILSYLRYHSRVKEEQKNKYRKNIPVKTGTRTTLLPVNDVTRIRAAGGYLEVYTSKRKYVVISTLKDILRDLDPDRFKRIHKSEVINLETVCEVKSRLTGDYDILTREGETLRLSRNYAREFKERLI